MGVPFLWKFSFTCTPLVSLPYFKRVPIFTVLHGMQTRSSDENSVCLSVRLSMKSMNCDKAVERSVQIFIPLSFMRRRMVGG